MVRWLVEHEKIRFAENHHRKRYARSFTAGKRISATLRLVAGESKTREVTLNLPSLPIRPQVTNDVVQGPIGWHLCHVLPVIARPNRSSDSQLATRNLTLTRECAKERGFSAAIRSDEAYNFTALDRGREVLDQGSPFNLDGDVLCDHHLVATSLGHIDPEAHRVSLFRRRAAESRQPIEAFASSLCLFCILTGDVAPDVVFLFSDHLALFVGSPLLAQSALFSLCDE
jgi:hypothetical protein